MLVARRKDALEAVSKACGGAFMVPADVTVRADVQQVLAKTLEHHGHIDVWVNNAGRGISRMPSKLTDADLDDMMSVNVKSALYGMQSGAAALQRRGEGQIINVSSMLGRVPFAVIRSAYSASKHFLNALTANFRVEVQSHAPGHPGLALLSRGRGDGLREERDARRARLAHVPQRPDRGGGGRRRWWR